MLHLWGRVDLGLFVVVGVPFAFHNLNALPSMAITVANDTVLNLLQCGQLIWRGPGKFG